MVTLTIRQKSMIYLPDADDNKILAVFAFLEKDIQNKTIVNLSEEQLAIIDKEHEMHLIEQTKFHTRREAHQLIKTSR